METVLPLSFHNSLASLRVSDVQTIIDALQSLNIPFESGEFEEFEYHNYYWVEWRDPDGIRLECVELILSMGEFYAN